MVMSFFWFLLILAAMAPVVKQRQIEMQRLRLHKKLQDLRQSRVITLIHRQETISVLGLPVSRHIDIDDSEHILRAIRMTPEDMPIDLVLHTPGGLVLATEQIARTLQNHKGKVTVFVPHYAMSGGTMIALSADEIVMDPNAVLGPVDPQLGGYPAVSILKAVSEKNIDEVEDKTLILADMASKAMEQVRSFVYSLLDDKLEKEKAEEVANTLSQGRWTHDYSITAEMASSFGLNVSTDMPQCVYEMMELYPQPAQRKSSVTVVPLSDGPERAKQ